MPNPITIEATSRGKVRDMYDLGDRLLVVATDRISAFDYVLPDEIPQKGRVLNKLSVFWFDLLADTIENHLISTDVADLPEQFKPWEEWLDGRFMLVRRANMFPVECIVRGYLTGSGLKSYQKTGEVCGIKLPEGLVNSSKIPETIFTPSTKAELGEHDENISFEQMVELVGDEAAQDLKDLTLKIYQKAADHAAERGIIIADTKLEFGTVDGRIILGRRGADARFVALLAGRHLRGGQGAAELRQAVCAQLAERQLGPHGQPAAHAAGCYRADHCEVHHGVRDDFGAEIRRLGR